MTVEPEGYLHTARYLVLPRGDGLEVVEDGCVLTRGGRIIACGPRAGMENPGLPVADHGEAVLVPPLVNCHCHLELSFLAPLSEDGAWRAPGRMAAWIEHLLAARDEATADAEERSFVAWQALAGLYRRGCAAVCDIGNDPAAARIGRDFKTRVLFFLEVLGMTAPLAPLAREIIADPPAGMSLAPHSPYGTAPDVIAALKRLARGRLFPIHLAESAEEVEFVANGTGPIARFLAGRGGTDPAFTPAGESPVAFLDRIGGLDENTLCVHFVQVDADDIALAARRRARVCLCPGSNRYLGVGTAPLAAILAAGIRPGIGTDSLASNPVLDLWGEMALLAAEHPEVDPAAVFMMASGWGADILGLAPELGRLAPGASSAFLAVRGPGLPARAAEVPAFLVHGGAELEVEWVEGLASRPQGGLDARPEDRSQKTVSGRLRIG